VPDRNSFRVDLEEIISIIKAPVFCLNVIVDHKRRILAACACHRVECHRAAIEHNAGKSLPSPIGIQEARPRGLWSS
jgi:hypothetical protein